VAKSRKQKEEVIKELEEKISRQKAMVFMDFSGINSADLFALRNKLKNSDCELKIIKKTLLEKTLQHLKNEELLLRIKEIKSQIALIFGFKDEVTPSRFASEALKNNEKFVILGGFLAGDYLEREKINEIAKILSRQELLAKMAGSLKFPAVNFANVLNGNIKGLLNVLSRIKF